MTSYVCHLENIENPFGKLFPIVADQLFNVGRDVALLDARIPRPWLRGGYRSRVPPCHGGAWRRLGRGGRFDHHLAELTGAKGGFGEGASTWPRQRILQQALPSH